MSPAEAIFGGLRDAMGEVSDQCSRKGVTQAEFVRMLEIVLDEQKVALEAVREACDVIEHPNGDPNTGVTLGFSDSLSEAVFRLARSCARDGDDEFSTRQLEAVSERARSIAARSEIEVARRGRRKV